MGRLRHLAAPALALAVPTTLPAARPTIVPASTPPAEFQPVSVVYGAQHGKTVPGQFLSYNDFHGAIDPPIGSGAVVNASGTSASYQVTTNDFLANGGDGFRLLTGGTGRTTAPGFDIDALTAYLGSNSPVAPGPANRITTIA
jgi:hypothetical protein